MVILYYMINIFAAIGEFGAVLIGLNLFFLL